MLSPIGLSGTNHDGMEGVHLLCENCDTTMDCYSWAFDDVITQPATVQTAQQQVNARLTQDNMSKLQVTITGVNPITAERTLYG